MNGEGFAMFRHACETYWLRIKGERNPTLNYKLLRWWKDGQR